MKKLLFAFIALQSFSALADCQRYIITYVENETDFQGKVRKTALQAQREDYKAIFANATRTAGSNCQFYIDGYDLKKDQKGKSKLTEIYSKISKDNSEALIDLISLTHGSGDAEVEIPGRKSMHVNDAFFNDMPKSFEKRPGVFADFACFGYGSTSVAIKKGFRAAIGVETYSLGPLVARDFFKNYLEGLTLQDVAEELNNECLNNEIWKVAGKMVTTDQEEYCMKAALKILGDAQLTIDSTKSELETKPQKLTTFKPGPAVKESIIKAVNLTSQHGDNNVNQVDLVTNNSFISRLSMTSSGQFGFQAGLVNEPHGKVLSIERDPSKNIALSATLASLNMNVFLAGDRYDNGFNWKYNLSVEGKAGYLRVIDKNQQTRNFVNIGSKLNNQVVLGYKDVSLDANAGYDLMVFNLNESPTYANGSLMLQTGESNVGAYFQHNSLLGNSGGVKASISLDDLLGRKKTK